MMVADVLVLLVVEEVRILQSHWYHGCCYSLVLVLVASGYGGPDPRIRYGGDNGPAHPPPVVAVSMMMTMIVAMAES